MMTPLPYQKLETSEVRVVKLFMRFVMAGASLAVWGLGLGFDITVQAQQETPMKVVFLGDSITQAGAGPAGYVTQLREALTERLENRATPLQVEVIGAGISGNKVPDLQKRLDRDVLAHDPQLVVIYIGINDVWHSQSGRGTPKDEFEAGLKELIDRIQGAGSKVILCTPSVIGEKTDGSNSLDSMLDEYAAVSRQVAQEKGVTLLDLRQKFLRELRILNEEGAEKGKLTSDGVHLNAEGNAFVKDCMLPVVESVLTGQSLKHVVMFKFKPDAREADINRVCQAFEALPSKIDTIIGFESGADISVENLNQGYTHCFVVAFSGMEGRDAYLPHEAHQEFVQLLQPFVDGALVVDFWSTAGH